jgi:hypothetical protein
MRMILAAASLALLAASAGGASNAVSGSGNGSALAAEPELVTNRVSAAPVAPIDPELVAMRAQGIAGCSAEASRRTAPGTDVARLCGCAVDRLMAGKTAAELPQTPVVDEQRALNACAGEQGVTLTAMPDSSAAPADDEEGNSAG